MLDRRQSAPDKVKTMYEGGSKTNENRTKSDAFAGNDDSSAEFTNVVNYPKMNRTPENVDLKNKPKSVSLVAKMVWWRDTFVRIAFGPELPGLPVSDLGERVLRSEKKKQQLQRRINDLINKK